MSTYCALRNTGLLKSSRTRTTRSFWAKPTRARPLSKMHAWFKTAMKNTQNTAWLSHLWRATSTLTADWPSSRSTRAISKRELGLSGLKKAAETKKPSWGKQWWLSCRSSGRSSWYALPHRSSTSTTGKSESQPGRLTTHLAASITTPWWRLCCSQAKCPSWSTKTPGRSVLSTAWLMRHRQWPLLSTGDAGIPTR